MRLRLYSEAFPASNGMDKETAKEEAKEIAIAQLNKRNTETEISQGPSLRIPKLFAVYRYEQEKQKTNSNF